MRFSSLLTLALASVALSRKVFIDNDSFTALNVLLPLLADIEIVGTSGSFGNPTIVDSLGTAADVLKNTSLTCIPLYEGPAAPLIRTEDTFNVWQSLYGEFVWKGAWDPDYTETYTWDDFSYNKTLPAAMALVEAVKRYPGEVEVYAAGLMTTVAQAISLYPKLAEEAKALWIMGGYIDGQYAQATGGDLVADINTDFNLMLDPEASQIALTANWTDIYIGGNVTNYIYPTQEFLDRFIDRYTLETIQNNTKFSSLSLFVGNGNASTITLPLWDEAVSGFMAFPELIESTTNVHVAVDTSFDSPFYGNLRIWPSDLAPASNRVGKAKYVNQINEEGLFERIYQAFTKDWAPYCSGAEPTELV